MRFKAIEPVGSKLKILDQRRLPLDVRYNEYDDYRDIIESIKTLEVRGAPAIGIAGAFALAIAAQAEVKTDLSRLKKILIDIAREIKSARPTAVNLAWAVERALNKANQYAGENIDEYRRILWDEASLILSEDEAMCRAIGTHGQALLKDGDTVLTHCNAGALATGGSGTALAVIYAARDAGKRIMVFADETRPLLQGARLTCWELMQEGIEVTLICDNTAGFLMQQGRINCIILGADRIAANGDFANKIGTYSVAVLAKEHGLPFYVAAPTSTFDPMISSGEDIPIEERAADEITNWGGVRTAPPDVKTYSPAFDITPAELVTAYITDKGITWGKRKGD
ncbi:MAG: S-methyl-5-thioribose-1-phosphate isomerase [bacterium]|jgi:methylthioribose-1-phosphate isomerase